MTFTRKKLISAGSFGVVFEARNNATGESVCWKQMPLTIENESDLINEVDVLSKLNHPRVLHFLAAFVNFTERAVVVVTDLCDGGDLNTVITEHRATKRMVPENDVWRYLGGTCEGLEYLHSERILHRDLKPANIFIHRGNAIIGDLGLGRLLPQSGIATSAVGTPLYMAPERCLGLSYGSSADVWSIGCIFHEVATLNPPFLHDSLAGLTSKILSDQPPHLPNIYSVELAVLINRLLKKLPCARPSASQILAYPALLVRCELENVRAELKATKLKLTYGQRFSDTKIHPATETPDASERLKDSRLPSKDCKCKIIRDHFHSPCNLNSHKRSTRSMNKSATVGKTPTLPITMPLRRRILFEGAVGPRPSPTRKIPWSPGTLGPPLRVPKTDIASVH